MSKNIQRKERTLFGSSLMRIYDVKFSILVIAFLVCIGFGLWQVVAVGDVASGLLSLIIALITAITGVSSIQEVASKKYESDYTELKQEKETSSETSNTYNTNYNNSTKNNSYYNDGVDTSDSV